MQWEREIVKSGGSQSAVLHVAFSSDTWWVCAEEVGWFSRSLKWGQNTIPFRDVEGLPVICMSLNGDL